MRTRSAIFVALFSCVILLAGCASAKKAGGPCSGCAKPCGTAGSPCAKPCTKMSDADFASWAKYGQKVKLAADKTVCAQEILGNPDKFAGKQVRVCGKIEAVCARKGCWIRLAGASDADSLFVKFTCPVDGRLVPMDAVGRMAIVEGSLQVLEISESDARHYKEEGGATPAEIAKIVGPQKQISLRAPAAMVQGA